MQPQSTVPDTEELVHFRERWKQEILGRPQSEQTSSSRQAQPAQRLTHHTSSIRRLTALETDAPTVPRAQDGNSPTAIRFSCNAFRRHGSLDSTYSREERTLHHQRDVLSSSSLHTNLVNPSLSEHKASVSGQAVPTQTLASLLESWSLPLLFAPEDKSHGVPIDRLPDELILSILSGLARDKDVNAIERFAAVSRRARILSLDASIWRPMVQLTLVPSQLADPTISLSELAYQYRSDYRRVYIEHPRLRLDGVYISICYYVRHGLAENPWVTTSHLITYRRFFFRQSIVQVPDDLHLSRRFLPNGEVLSYRTNEDQDVADVVHALQPGLRRKDLYVGNWRLMGTTVLVTDLVKKAPAGCVENDKYRFQMSLRLKSRPLLGKWNKLELYNYESVHAETGETRPLLLRHEQPYWFSKVRSYL